MAREINLNSIAWCDLVFEGKNKEYGAYEMRQTASKRHIIAFLVTFSVLSLFVAVPSLLEEAGVGVNRLDGTTDVTTLSVIEPIQDENPPIEEPISQPPPPPVEIQKALAHTPPTIVDDETDTAGKEMLSVDELNKDKSFLISNVTYLEGSSKGVDPGEILGEIGGQTGGAGGQTLKPELMPDIQAKFLGGDTELMQFLQKNIRYPQIAIENDIQGRTVIRFVVGLDGSISDVKVLKSSDPSLDKEALRVVKSMPNWVPGMKDGRKVASYFTLPVTFRLSNR